MVDSLNLEIEVHNIKIDIKNFQEIIVAEKYTIRNNQNISLDSINLWINQSLDNLVVSDLEGTLNFDRNQFSETSNLLEIHFRSGLEQIPLDVFAKAIAQTSVDEFIEIYKHARKTQTKKSK